MGVFCGMLKIEHTPLFRVCVIFRTPYHFFVMPNYKIVTKQQMLNTRNNNILVCNLNYLLYICRVKSKNNMQYEFRESF